MATTPALETLDVQLLHADARMPERTRPGDAGLDLRCLEAFTLAPGERSVVGTGIAIALPPGVAGLVVPRSGLAAKHGISVVNGPGLIDPNYRGEIGIVLINLGTEPFTADAGDRVAQLLLVPFASPAIQVVDDLRDSDDDRGAAGFGSSGR